MVDSQRLEAGRTSDTYAEVAAVCMQVFLVSEFQRW